VMTFVQSDDEELRYDALSAVVALKGAESIDLLIRTVKEDKSKIVRECALRACTTIEPPTSRCFEVLYEGLKDEDMELRDIAVMLLRKGFNQYFRFFPNDTLGNREKAMWHWSAWYRTRKDKLQWNPEKRFFEVPGEKEETKTK